jgi:acetyl-CoA carboxylase biotin carboxyl carrier protein
MPEKSRTDLQKIKDLIELMKVNDLIELEIVDGHSKIHLKRPQVQPPSVTALPVAVPAIPQAAQSPSVKSPDIQTSPIEPQGLEEIKSPMVGTFYSAPSPDSEPYVEVGLEVEPDTVVCIIEAMKVMNEIKAQIAGTVTGIMVANGQAVEYGEVLFTVKPH